MSQTTQEQTEVEMLRARVAELEAERAELVRNLNRALGEAQERAYWAERLENAGIDLGRILDSPAGKQAWLLAASARVRLWKVRLLYRKVVGKLRSML